MYVAEPPRLRQPGEAIVPLYIVAAHRQTFHQTSRPSPDLAVYTADLAAQYGFPVREEVLARPHPSYALMGETMRATLDSETDPVDLVVLAYALPEVDPARCIATRLNLGSTGNAFAFCVSDQGTAAPFTGLTLIAEYLRSRAHSRALLVVVEQAEVAYATPPGTVLPARDSAVALLFGGVPAVAGAAGAETGRARVAALRQLTAVAPPEVDAAVAVELAALPAGPPATLVRHDGAALPHGMLCTAPWWTLVEELDRKTVDPHRMVIVDYEPRLRYLSILTVDVE